MFPGKNDALLQVICQGTPEKLTRKWCGGPRKGVNDHLFLSTVPCKINVEIRGFIEGNLRLTPRKTVPLFSQAGQKVQITGII